MKTDENLPIAYSINIETLSTSRRPLTCCITTDGSRIAKQRTINQLNHVKPATHDFRIKPLGNPNRSSIHLPVTYSSTIHVPCHPSTIKSSSPPIILPSQSSSHHHHHHHYYHHYYHHHHHRRRQPSPSISSRQSTTIKHKIVPQHTSLDSTHPTTRSSTTYTSPESLLSIKKPTKNTHVPVPLPVSASDHRHKQLSPPLPSYSTLVWNWFHQTPVRTPARHLKGSQSDYSETYRHEHLSKRSLLLKFLTSPIEKSTKSKHSRTCFTRKRLESSSSLPSKHPPYNE